MISGANEVCGEGVEGDSVGERRENWQDPFSAGLPDLSSVVEW